MSCWPNSSSRSPVSVETAEAIQDYLAWEFHGQDEPVALGSPAAGAALTVTVPGAVEWEVLAASFLYTASSNSANRIPLINFLDWGGTIFCQVKTPYKLIATNVAQVTFGVGIQQFGADSAASIGAGIPPMRIGDGLRVQLTAAAIDTADTITAARLFVRRWRLRE